MLKMMINLEKLIKEERNFERNSILNYVILRRKESVDIEELVVEIC